MPGFLDKAADVWAGEKSDSDGLRAELTRLSSLTLEQVAAEVMTKGFGPGGPGAAGHADPDVIGAAFTQPFQGRDYDQEVDVAVMEIVAEGLQVLEHACLIRPVFHGQGGSHDVHYALGWGATRLGRAAVEQGTVERALAG
jgi:hypothetical protein